MILAHGICMALAGDGALQSPAIGAGMAADDDDRARIDFLTAESSIVLDREGRWLHDGEPVTHRGLAEALHRWIDFDEATSRYVLQAGRERCFIEVEDTPYFVRGVVWTGEPDAARVMLRLSDGTEEELDYATLRQAPDNVLYCDVKGGRMPARFDRAAYYRVAERVDLDQAGPVLAAAGSRWPIRRGDGTRPRRPASP